MLQFTRRVLDFCAHTNIVRLAQVNKDWRSLATLWLGLQAVQRDEDEPCLCVQLWLREHQLRLDPL